MSMSPLKALLSKESKPYGPIPKGRLYVGFCVNGPHHGFKYASTLGRFYLLERDYPSNKIILGEYVWYSLTQEWVWFPHKV